MLTGFENRNTLGTPRAGECVLSDLRSDLISSQIRIGMHFTAPDQHREQIRRGGSYQPLFNQLREGP